jgi:hypothetical protein
MPSPITAPSPFALAAGLVLAVVCLTACPPDEDTTATAGTTDACEPDPAVPGAAWGPCNAAGACDPTGFCSELPDGGTICQPACSTTCPAAPACAPQPGTCDDAGVCSIACKTGADCPPGMSCADFCHWPLP